ncbi:MAG: bifunctional enoyl-CoA hydratase/phosphate acetyltransferase [Bacteroidetes bacterium]|uniref:Bifunctional enoyl-CoA hydratase/phosphate acetyltransferase n=1 Tax=Candidatus Pullibacteroides excrementavium TaxID=2840905 RepID=A0A9D9DU05_9BACT|nr:bifunctional enoyl-CoA hydratase/phosphate acetyltransferase [Candidatus Pullibacteroides excrementavium]
MAISKLDQLFDLVKANGKKRLVAAYAVDDHTVTAVSKAVDLGIVDATLVGDTEMIKKVCENEQIDINKFKIVQEKDDNKAAQMAVKLINAGEGDVLMKGLVSTDKYMRAILNKENGLMPGPKAMLTHIALLQNPFYHKLLVASDIAIIPAPDLKQKTTICNYLISTAHSIGVEKPKVAVLAATEQMSAGMQACVDAALIAKMADRGQIKGGYVDGPLALDVAIDPEACQIKGVGGPVAGDADCLLFPNIESGNIFYKMHTKFCKGEVAAMVVGAKVPCVLSSRGDTTKTKLNSIALAALSCRK